MKSSLALVFLMLALAEYAAALSPTTNAATLDPKSHDVKILAALTVEEFNSAKKAELSLVRVAKASYRGAGEFQFIVFAEDVLNGGRVGAYNATLAVTADLQELN